MDKTHKGLIAHPAVTAIAIFALAVATLPGHGRAYAAMIDTIGSAVVADFTGFDGSGFSAAPAAGQLDTDDWRITGLSDGDMIFGGTYLSGDYARGASTGGVTTGGIYAFDVGNGAAVESALGVQPIGTDFTPGAITYRLINQTGTPLTRMDVAYSVYIYNDQDRASSFNLAYSGDDIAYTAAPALDVTSTELGELSPLWQRIDRAIQLTGLDIANGQAFFLQWLSDDVAGTGSRDEFALDNVSVTAYDGVTPVPVPPALWLFGTSLIALLTMTRNRTG